MNRKERIDYRERLGRVTAYIYDHLDAELDLNRLAEIACLSPWHWHRVYHAMHGETIAATVKRLRLHRAAGFLANSSMAIEEIARRAGYTSAAAFTRAFADAYGMPPAEYRRNGAHAQFRAPNAQGSHAAYDIAIRDVPKLHVVSLEHVGPYMQIGQAFDRLFGTLDAAVLARPNLRMLGVYYDDPDAVAEDRLRARACVAVDMPAAVDPPLAPAEIAGGRYAVLRHKGAYATMRAAYQWLYGTWLVEAGEEARDAPVLEEYLNNPRDTRPTELLTDVYLPLRP
jgi:AraC family transcriptional regulator